MSESTPELSKSRRQRREKILNAAQTVFLHTGFRNATMEAIAAQAAISKATLYAYFTDKDAAFLAVSGRFAAQLSNGMKAHLQSQATTVERIHRALSFKHEQVFNLVRTSSHADEVFTESNRLSGHLIAELDRDAEHHITDLLKKNGHPNTQSIILARLLWASANGIAERAETIDMLKADIEVMVKAFIAPAIKRPLGPFK